MFLKRVALTCVFLLPFYGTFSQVIPDLTIGDNFRPYLTEGQKREQILNALKNYPKTSEELYPELYKYTNKDYLEPIRGTSADPENAFKNQAQIGFNKQTTPTTPNTNYGIPKSVYESGLSIQQRNQLMMEADMKAYEEQKIRSQQIIEEAYQELYTPTISYTLGLHSGDKVDRYVKAYAELESMLSGKQKIDFLKAVWLVESAADPSLSWEEFNGMFQDGLQIIMELMRQDKLSPTDNLAKLMATYKYMADTTKVFIAAKEKTLVSKPMLYDFEDYGGEKDPTKVFVSKLLRTGTGQCMSLPMLYYLFAKALGAEANLALAPEHSYITFKDNFGKRQNIELTGRMFTTTDFYWQTGVIKTEQTKSGIYLTPLSEKETLAELLTTLSKTYVKRFGVDDRLLEIATTAREYHPNSLSANMLLVGYSHELWKNVLRQYDVYGLSDNQLQNDEKAQAIKFNKDVTYNHLMKDLGYAKMPDWAYQVWLKGVNELANKQQHIVRRRQLEQQLNK